jgi:hypothetical protein
MMQSVYLDVLERQRAKQLSRDQDDRDLRSGAISRSDLAHQNGFIDGLAVSRGRIARRGSVAF